MSSSSMARNGWLICLVGAFMMVFSPAKAGPPDSENGRYSFSPTSDGVLRLDTRTGSIATCRSVAQAWTCHAVPDERAALDAEIGRLLAENERLKADLARLGKANGPVADQETGKRGNKLELQLPDDRDIDRIVSFLDRAWRKLLDMAGRVQKDVSGRV